MTDQLLTVKTEPTSDVKDMIKKEIEDYSLVLCGVCNVYMDLRFEDHHDHLQEYTASHPLNDESAATEQFSKMLKHDDIKLEFEVGSTTQYIKKTKSVPQVQIHGSPSSLLRTLRALRERVFCDSCGKSYTSKDDLVKHMRIHNVEQLKSYNKYSKSFSSKISQRNNKNAHITRNLYNCNLCGKSFIRASKLKVHKRTHRLKEPHIYGHENNTRIQSVIQINSNGKCVEKKRYPCNYCGKLFFYNSWLQEHTRTHTKTKPYTCEYCKKSFSKKQYFKIHCSRHPDGKLNSQYDKSFVNTSFVKINSKCFICDCCGLISPCISKAKDHNRTHTGERSFNCELCGKWFNRRATLNIHKRTHTGEKPFSCDHCKKSFTQRSNLLTHKLTCLEKTV